MDAEEREIYQFLKGWKNEFVSAKEVCRRAGGKSKYQEDRDWARSFLMRMTERGILESDDGGRYRIKSPKAAESMQRWVAPQIADAFKSSGKDFGTIVISDADLDDYYDKL